MVDGTFVDAIAAMSAEISRIYETDRVVAFDVPDGHSVQIESFERFQDRPYRKHGKATLNDLGSFIAYVSQHFGPGTTIYAAPDRAAFTAIINGHEAVSEGREGSAGWGDHTVVFSPRFTPAWAAWTTLNRWYKQEEFAEFIENRLGDILEPDGAVLLQMVTNFKIHSQVTYERAVFTQDGRVQLLYKEDDAPGEMKIPADLRLLLKPWDGADDVELTARLRFTRPTPAKPVVEFRWDLGDEPRRIIDAAITSMSAEITAMTGRRVLRGSFEPK